MCDKTDGQYAIVIVSDEKIVGTFREGTKILDGKVKYFSVGLVNLEKVEIHHADGTLLGVCDERGKITDATKNHSGVEGYINFSGCFNIDFSSSVIDGSKINYWRKYGLSSERVITEEEWFQAQAKELADIRKLVFHSWHKDGGENNDRYFPDEVDSKYKHLLILLKIAICPNCDGSGSISYQISGREYVTADMARDAGDPSLEGSLYSHEQWEQEQCQWCAERSQIIASIGE